MDLWSGSTDCAAQSGVFPVFLHEFQHHLLIPFYPSKSSSFSPNLLCHPCPKNSLIFGSPLKDSCSSLFASVLISLVPSLPSMHKTVFQMYPERLQIQIVLLSRFLFLTVNVAYWNLGTLCMILCSLNSVVTNLRIKSMYICLYWFTLVISVHATVKFMLLQVLFSSKEHTWIQINWE